MCVAAELKSRGPAMSVALGASYGPNNNNNSRPFLIRLMLQYLYDAMIAIHCLSFRLLLPQTQFDTDYFCFDNDTTLIHDASFPIPQLYFFALFLIIYLSQAFRDNRFAGCFVCGNVIGTCCMASAERSRRILRMEHALNQR